MSPRARFRLQLVGTLLSTLVAVAGAVAIAERARAVDVVTLFAGGVCVGATLVGVVRAARERRRRDPRLPPDPAPSRAESPPEPSAAP